MNILIAPNAFKHSLAAREAALAIHSGLRRSRLKGSYTCFPVGDGGNGTGSLLTRKSGGIKKSLWVHDPLGRRLKASFGWINDSATAVIEMADASGLHLLRADELNPLVATSFGTGELIRGALDKKARRIIIAMGGSATVDGGMGILTALGIRFLNGAGRQLHTPEEMVALSRLDTSATDRRIESCELIVLCDVDNRLTGDEGAAKMFGPQKGATVTGIGLLNNALVRLADVIFRETGCDVSTMRNGGTAGGAAAGIAGLLGAKPVSGIEYFLQMTNFDDALKKCDLVITGEGSIDEQTLRGKAPFGVARRAKKYGLPVVAFAGKIPLTKKEALHRYFDVLLPIGNEPTDIAGAIRNTKSNLIRTATEMGNILALGAQGRLLTRI